MKRGCQKQNLSGSLFFYACAARS
jgi:lipoprotein